MRFFLIYTFLFGLFFSCKEASLIDGSKTGFKWIDEPNAIYYLDRDQSNNTFIVQILAEDNITPIKNATITFGGDPSIIMFNNPVISSDNNGLAVAEFTVLDTTSSLTLSVSTPLNNAVLSKTIEVLSSSKSIILPRYNASTYAKEQYNQTNDVLSVFVGDKYKNPSANIEVKYEVIEGDAMLRGQKTITTFTNRDGYTDAFQYFTGVERSIIRASTIDGNSTDFEINSIHPISLTSVSLEKGEMKLEWENIPEGVNFEILRRNDIDYTYDTLRFEGESTTEFIDENLNNGVKYAYRLDLVLGGGEEGRLEGELTEEIRYGNYIYLGYRITDMIYDDTRNLIYACNGNTHEVIITDLDGDEIKYLYVGGAPNRLMLTENKLYVALKTGGAIAIIDLETYAIDKIDVYEDVGDYEIMDIEVLPKHNMAYLVCGERSKLFKLDLNTKEVSELYNPRTSTEIISDNTDRIYFSAWIDGKYYTVVYNEEDKTYTQYGERVSISSVCFSPSYQYIYSTSLLSKNNLGLEEIQSFGEMESIYSKFPGAFSDDENYLYLIERRSINRFNLNTLQLEQHEDRYYGVQKMYVLKDQSEFIVLMNNAEIHRIKNPFL
ncbi:YncE family protein [Flammeovirga aprica]|uniref:Uncharacterized protein n=1 Tax=Flammeovirga aprica JL-4 TaxID=694437 RepID=A0A7X9XBT9_9BACT|nr:hypothetical protein [Flammeovirga aprica]NME71097.1 hypothetical protein [Flammeovirga aprica JL-4]